MAQITSASPVSLKVTSVAAPGGCDPRLNTLPLLVETMLWGTVSSFANVTDSPFLMVMLSDENRRPFWVIVRLAARAPADRPTRTTTARDVSMRIGYSCGWLFRSAGENRHGGRIEMAGQSFHEGDQFGLLLRRETERLHQVGAARAVYASLVIMFDHLFKRGDRSIVHKGTSSGDFAQPRGLEGVLHLDDTRQELAPPDVGAGEADVLETIVGEVPALMAR